MYKVVLWGLGGGYDVFTSHHGHSMVDVVAVATNNTHGYHCIDGAPIILPDKIKEFPYDYLIICATEEKVYKDILRCAIGVGIKRESIIPVRVFEIPFFNFDDYVKIKNSNLSFLSNYCFAGLLYHRFGFRFTSPTINMFTDSNSYLRLLRDIKGYLSMEMEEVADVVNNPYLGAYSYPRGRLGDTEWMFCHDTVFGTAKERWDKGVERFNFSNFVVFMAIRSDEAAYEFDSLPIEHKLGFYFKDLHLDSVLYCPEWNEPSTREKNHYNFGHFVNRIADGKLHMKNIDWMKFLLFEKEFVRKK